MKHRRNVLLVNPRFQLKYSFYVVSWIFALSVVYPMITNQLFDYFIGFAQRYTSTVSLQELDRIRGDFIQLLMLLHLVFMGVIFLISIFMSHKIAGPVFKLRKHFQDAKDGNFSVHCQFRKADHFTELAEDFNELMSTVRTRVSHDHEAATKAALLLEGLVEKVDAPTKETLEDALTELRKVRAVG